MAATPLPRASSTLSLRHFLLAAIGLILVSMDTASGLSPYLYPASIAMSSYAIQKWAGLKLGDNLQQYINHEEKRLRVLKYLNESEPEIPLVSQRLAEFKIIHKDLVKNATKIKTVLKTNHPTSVFAELRNFLANFEDKLANRTGYGKRLREFLEANGTKPLPSRKDLSICGTGITVLQATYNLSMADLLKGQILGHQGEPLSAADCYDIGKIVLGAGLLDTAHEWLTAAINSTDLDQVDMRTMAFNVTDALVILGKVAYQRKDKNKAMKLLEKAVEIEPDNMGVHQDYMKHRFGRDVEPLTELDREKVEPWRKKFFDMCYNSTDKEALEEQRLQYRTKLRCRLRRSMVVPYLYYKEEILSKSPYISVLLDFLNDREVDDLKNSTLSQLFPQVVPGNKKEKNVQWQSKVNWFWDKHSEVIGRISWRVGDVTGLNVTQDRNKYSLGEPLHVIDYGVAGLSLPHAEYLRTYDTKYMGLINGKRFATVQIFLSDVAAGGATVFINQNITVIPKKGHALLWYNFLPSSELEWTLLPATCPLAVGENIVVEKGIWRIGNDVTSVCGKSPKSTFLTAEKAMLCKIGVCR